VVSGRRPQRVFFDSNAPAGHSENPLGPSFSDESMVPIFIRTCLRYGPFFIYIWDHFCPKTIRDVAGAWGSLFKNEGKRAKTLQKGAPKAGGDPHAPALAMNKKGTCIASKITPCVKTSTYATKKLISKLFWSPVIWDYR
jgi:hypothetical protein